MDKVVMTIQEVAEFLRVSERTVYDWTNKGIIPASKIGTTWRFKRSSIEALLEDKKKGAFVFSSPKNMDVVKIGDIVVPTTLTFLDDKNKEKALTSLVSLLSAEISLSHKKEELLDGILKREKLLSTGIGYGIAVPHVRTSLVTSIVLGVGVCRDGLNDYVAIDKEPVKAIFLIFAGEDQHKEQLKLFAAISKKVREPDFREAFISAQDIKELRDLLGKAV